MPARPLTTEDLTPLVCPACHALLKLTLGVDRQQLILCPGCGRRYPVLDGIPILLPHSHL